MSSGCSSRCSGSNHAGAHWRFVTGLPFVVQVAQDGADEADDGWFVREDADNAGSSLEALMSAVWAALVRMRPRTA